MTGADLPTGLLFHPDSAVNGFCVAYENGITIYDTADTCLFSDMQLIGQMYGPQVAIMPVGGQYTMGVREAARAGAEAFSGARGRGPCARRTCCGPPRRRFASSAPCWPSANPPTGHTSF